VAYYRSAQQCQHARAAFERRWAEYKYICEPIYR
jgi:hypothetical protein